METESVARALQRVVSDGQEEMCVQQVEAGVSLVGVRAWLMRVRVRSTDLWLRALYYLRVHGRQATA